MTESIRDVYHKLLQDGGIIPDQAQADLLDDLEGLENILLKPVSTTGLMGKLFRKRAATSKGLYLWGSVGRGKSMLMDLFYDHIPIEEKRRLHFLTFIQEIHDRLKVIRQQEVEDVIPPLSDIFAQDLKFLCLDEFQIDNVPDGVIVGRLLKSLFAKGTVLFTTSNRQPSELYKDGLNRHLIESYIQVLESNLNVVEFGGRLDHRKNRLQGKKSYFHPANEMASQGLEAIWQELSGGHSERLKIEFKGREILFSQFSNGTLRTHFWELCGQPLGPPDFLAIANNIKVLILEDVPLLSRQNYNEAKRFVMLVDTLYENRIKLFVSAASNPENLYIEGSESFEFNRAVSRLNEMQSKNWGN